jgi:hypothetical protein
MKKEAGLWIDHRQAVIVTLVDQVEEIKRITSNGKLSQMWQHGRGRACSTQGAASYTHTETCGHF